MGEINCHPILKNNHRTVVTFLHADGTNISSKLEWTSESVTKFANIGTNFATPHIFNDKNVDFLFFY